MLSSMMRSETKGRTGIVSDDDGGVVRLALVLKVADGVHDGIVALGTASDDVDGIGVLQGNAWR